ncbi:MAG: BolA family transcriptional regulator, partial [Deltaproteobacteria bacterium]|nr:BolA family transcriptional regulator [Deltaproteobacteria bacterium]
MMHPDEVREKLVQSFPNSEVVVQDTTGTMDHFQVLIISPLFEGKTMV